MGGFGARHVDCNCPCLPPARYPHRAMLAACPARGEVRLSACKADIANMCNFCGEQASGHPWCAGAPRSSPQLPHCVGAVRTG